MENNSSNVGKGVIFSLVVIFVSWGVIDSIRNGYKTKDSNVLNQELSREEIREIAYKEILKDGDYSKETEKKTIEMFEKAASSNSVEEISEYADDFVDNLSDDELSEMTHQMDDGEYSEYKEFAVTSYNDGVKGEVGNNFTEYTYASYYDDTFVLHANEDWYEHDDMYEVASEPDFFKAMKIFGFKYIEIMGVKYKLGETSLILTR